MMKNKAIFDLLRWLKTEMKNRDVQYHGRYRQYSDYVQYSEFRAHSGFQGKRKLLKKPECK